MTGATKATVGAVIAAVAGFAVCGFVEAIVGIGTLSGSPEASSMLGNTLSVSPLIAAIFALAGAMVGPFVGSENAPMPSGGVSTLQIRGATAAITFAIFMFWMNGGHPLPWQ